MNYHKPIIVLKKEKLLRFLGEYLEYIVFQKQKLLIEILSLYLNYGNILQVILRLKQNYQSLFDQRQIS